MSNKIVFVIFIISLAAPALVVGERSFYLFEIVALLSFLFLVVGVGSLKMSRSDVLVLYSLFLVSFLTVVLQQYFYSSIHSSSLIRFLFVAAVTFFFRYFVLDYERFVNIASIFILAVVVVGILQFVDGFLLNNYAGFNNLVARLYPYTGELSASELAKTGGAHIKSGSFYRSTSIFDGHPIIYGDFLALISVFFLHWRRYVVYSVLFVGVVLTFSRGSWLMFVVGLCVYYFLAANKFNFRVFAWVVFSILCLLVVVVAVPAIRDAIYFRISNTLYTFGLSDTAVGRANDPRTATVWPEFIRVMNENAPYSYIAGYNAGIPTDSGYLAVLRESGVMGFVFFIIFSSYILIRSNFDKVILTLFFVLAVGMIVHPVHQGYRGLFMICVCIAFHINFIKRSYNAKDMPSNVRSCAL